MYLLVKLGGCRGADAMMPALQAALQPGQVKLVQVYAARAKEAAATSPHGAKEKARPVAGAAAVAGAGRGAAAAAGGRSGGVAGGQAEGIRCRCWGPRACHRHRQQRGEALARAQRSPFFAVESGAELECHSATDPPFLLFSSASVAGLCPARAAGPCFSALAF